MQNAFGSLLTAMVTPFDRQQRVNHEQVAKLAKQLTDRGSDGLVITGTTGESPTLSNEEKLRIYDTVVRAVKGKTKVIAGTGCNSTLSTIETSKKAEEIGVDGLMLVVPYYNKPPQEGLYLHFKSVAEAVSLPIILYNVPGRTAVNLSAATTLKLAEIDNIVAVKEASGNLEQVTYICKGAPEGFDVYSGDDSLTLPVLSVGGKGVVSVASHLVGLEMKAMINSFFEGKIEAAVKKHQHLMPLFKALFVITNPIPVKAALNIAGIDVGRTRLPLSDMPESMAAELLDLLKSYGIV